MFLLRRSFTLLLVLVLLPWGALVHAAQSAPPPPLSAAIDNPTPARAAPVPHKCRTATLTGGVCRLDFSPDDDDELSLQPQRDPGLGPLEEVTPAEWNDPVPIPPPRLN